MGVDSNGLAPAGKAAHLEGHAVAGARLLVNLTPHTAVCGVDITTPSATHHAQP